MSELTEQETRVLLDEVCRLSQVIHDRTIKNPPNWLMLNRDVLALVFDLLDPELMTNDELTDKGVEWLLTFSNLETHEQVHEWWNANRDNPDVDHGMLRITTFLPVKDLPNVETT